MMLMTRGVSDFQLVAHLGNVQSFFHNIDETNLKEGQMLTASTVTQENLHVCVCVC